MTGLLLKFAVDRIFVSLLVSGEIVLYVFILLLLLTCSAFFSASETAIFSLSSLDIARFKQERKKAGMAVVFLLEKPRRLLIAILFGNTLVNILFFSISTVISVLLRNDFGSSALIGGVISVVTVILFGEVIPKSIAVQRPVLISLWIGILLLPIYKFFTPVIEILDYIIRFFSRMLGADNREKYLTTGEFKLLADIGEQKGVLGASDREMLLEVLDLQKVRARELMIPRVEMVKCKVSSSRQEIFDLFCKSKVTKLPVYEKDEDDILGIIYAKEFLLNPNCEIEKLVRKISFVPESMKIEPLLKFLRNEPGNAALVVDEYGGIEGFITIKDIVEELVGEIEDEYDTAELFVRETGQGNYHVLGKMPLREWCEYFRIKCPPSPCNTISGFVTSQLQKFPQKGDKIRYCGLDISVLEARRYRIMKLLIEKT